MWELYGLNSCQDCPLSLFLLIVLMDKISGCYPRNEGPLFDNHIVLYSLLSHELFSWHLHVSTFNIQWNCSEFELAGVRFISFMSEPMVLNQTKEELFSPRQGSAFS